MKIIHCADIHLDSPLATNFTPEQARERNAEITRTFQRLCEYAGANDVRVVLIAGDFFDGRRVSSHTVDIVFDAMRRTPQVDYLYVSGNHDELSAVFLDRERPENFKQFSDQWQSYIYDDVAISSVQLTEQNTVKIYDDLPVQDGKYHIVMLHGQIGSKSEKDSVNLDLLKGKGIDYLALGHIHSYSQNPLDAKGTYCYPGCLEGRGFDEFGEKGFVLLDINDRRCTLSFVPFAFRTIYRVVIDITGMDSNSQVFRAMREATQDIDGKHLTEFVLKGKIQPETQISTNYLLNLVTKEFYAARIKDETTFMFQIDDYKNDVSLKGEYIRQILSSNLDEKEKERLIQIGLEALRGEAITL